MKEWFKVLLLDHKWRVIWVALGLLIGILILTINFWRTLLLCIIIGLCYVFGSLMDKGGWQKVKEFLDFVLPRK